MNTSVLSAGNWIAFVRSDVYAGQVNEDGERPDELCYYVVCENEMGVRFRSHKHFTTEDLGRAAAEGSAESFCEHVTKFLAKGMTPVRSEKWSRIQGMYGSPAWSDAYEIELDARDLEGEVGGGIEEANRMRREAGIGF
jgi:hypothetical protein